MKHRIFLISFLIIFSISAYAQEIGLQLYSLRNQFPKDVDGTMAKIHSWGIKDVELAGTYGLSIEEFNKLLKKNGLVAMGTAADYNRLAIDPQAIVADAKAFGVKYVACHWIPHNGNEFGIEEAKKVVEVFNKAGKILKENGFTFCWHPHGFEFRPYEGGTLFDYMVKNLDPAYVNFEMDIFWVKHPGQDPVALLKKYPKRFFLMHLKDRKKGTEGNQDGKADVETNVVLGTGDLDVENIMKTARKIGVKYAFIEDESSHSEEQIPLSLVYLKSIKY